MSKLYWFSGLTMAALSLAACARAGHSQAADATANPWPPPPSREFLALDREARNLAVYDAFWRQIDTNYYDPQAFASEEWRARRAEWRKEAAAATARVMLYHNVFPRLIQLLPESHVEVMDPQQPSNTDKEPAGKPVDADTVRRLATL